MFNSALAYERHAQTAVEPLLRQVPLDPRAHRSETPVKILEWFLPTGTDYVPDNSILRESSRVDPDQF